MKYRNPILPGFNPDPSVCRVGDDYYLVTSTFEFFPGIPVYHSRDLVNWTQLGSCIDRPEQLPFDRAAAGRGMWAPTIRYHQGRFYVTAKFMEFGNFIVSTDDPAGRWSDPVPVAMDGIDPSLLFDGGKAYYCTNQRDPQGREAITLAEVDPDTGALLSPARPIWHGVAADRPQYLEAPHVYHIGGWYYVMASEGGTGFEHMITAARSRCVWGPYEDCPHNPLLTNRYVAGTGVACSGHGDLVEDGRGNWWCVHLATRPDDRWYSHMGRETFLLPVAWRDEWPVIADGISRLDCEGALSAPQRRGRVWQADLSRIEPRWLFVRHPARECYTVAPEGLLLTPSAVRLTDQTGSPTLMAIRQPDIDCVIEAELAFTPCQDGDEAGLTIYISCDGHYRFGKLREAGEDYMVVTRQKPDGAPVRLRAPEGRLTLRVEASGTACGLFFAAEGQTPVHLASIPVLRREDAGKCFTGTLIGVYAQCLRPTAAKATLYRFTARS
ncbi:MAG: family 43 glycosylhydrolase [Aristaeellaceae bacterium]